MDAYGFLITMGAVSAGFRAGDGTRAAAASRDTLTGAAEVAAGLPAKLGAAVLDAAHQAFTAGMQVAAATSAVLLAGLSVLVLAALRHVPPTGAESEGNH